MSEMRQNDEIAKVRETSGAYLNCFLMCEWSKECDGISRPGVARGKGAQTVSGRIYRFDPCFAHLKTSSVTANATGAV